MKPVSILALCIPLALLAACGGGDKKEKDKRTASGKVLKGTISDAMIPLETVQSQPPLAKASSAPSGGDAPAAEETPAPEPTASADAASAGEGDAG